MSPGKGGDEFIGGNEPDPTGLLGNIKASKHIDWGS